MNLTLILAIIITIMFVIEVLTTRQPFWIVAFALIGAYDWFVIGSQVLYGTT